MLDTTTEKIILGAAILAAGIAGYSIISTGAEPYECYYWKLAPDKPLIICNYPGTTDMYHSYEKEKDLQIAMITAGATYTYSGKHPSGLNYTTWEKQKVKP